MSHSPAARCWGELKHSPEFDPARLASRSVKEEMRENLASMLRRGKPVFPGILGFDETVVPQIINAILSRHNFILLGLRGQAKSRILRQLTALLDPAMPALAGCEIHDNPAAPLCRRCRELLAQAGDDAPIEWLAPEQRYVEKLATPDVTIADLIGDIDPIKAARGGMALGNELTVHFGLLPRAHRGIFAINELPDLAGKIQVGLFNIMQEGDVQIKGYPVRLPVDVALVFSANPEDYTARGKIVTPLKDRIGSEIRTHYPQTLDLAVAITTQEARIERNGTQPVVPRYVREVVEAIAFAAREDKRVDQRSGVSQRLPITCLENAVSNAERRALARGEAQIVARVLDIHEALPALTGKLELEYEGELRGPDHVARELVRAAIGRVFDAYFKLPDLQPVVQWFELGGALQLAEDTPAKEALARLRKIQGLEQHFAALGLEARATAAEQVAAGEFILEGLHAHKRIGRNEELGYHAAPKPRAAAEAGARREEYGRRPLN